jgi:hypothetical protein
VGISRLVFAGEWRMLARQADAVCRTIVCANYSEARGVARWYVRNLARTAGASLKG